MVDWSIKKICESLSLHSMVNYGETSYHNLMLIWDIIHRMMTITHTLLCVRLFPAISRPAFFRLPFMRSTTVLFNFLKLSTVHFFFASCVIQQRTDNDSESQHRRSLNCNKSKRQVKLNSAMACWLLSLEKFVIQPAKNDFFRWVEIHTEHSKYNTIHSALMLLPLCANNDFMLCKLVKMNVSWTPKNCRKLSSIQKLQACEREYDEI